MDKDLTDAVLAAFDGEPEGEKPASDQATDGADGAAAAEAEKAATVVTKPGSAQKKTVLGAATSARRAPAPATATIRKAAPVREPAEEQPAAAAAVPRQHAAPVYAPTAATTAPRAAASAKLALLLTVVLVALVAFLLVQTSSLKAAVSRQDAALKELKNLARITVSVYHEPGKRPQKVIAVHDLDADGKLKLSKMTILPLDEE